MLHTITDEEEKQGKVRTIFMLDRDKRLALEKLSADSGAPLSELLRRALGQYLTTRGA